MKKIALIRPERQLVESVELLKSYGYDPVAAPLVDVVPVDDPKWDNFIAALNADQVDYIIITSANGVERCIELGLSGLDLQQHVKVVAIGPKTKKALLNHGIRVDLVPVEYSSYGILTLIQAVSNKNIWMLRSAYGSDILREGLQKSGANVNEVILYSLGKLCGERQKKLIDAIINGNISVVLFTSSMTVKSFFECSRMLGVREQLSESLKRCLIASIGKPTAETLERYGIHIDVIPVNATYADLIKAVDEILTAASR